MATEQQPEQQPMGTKVGTVMDYYARIGVAAVSLVDGDLRVGDRIRIHGHTTDFTQAVDSLEVNHQPVPRADRGTEIALKVAERVRRHDLIYRVSER